MAKLITKPSAMKSKSTSPCTHSAWDTRPNPDAYTFSLDIHSQVLTPPSALRIVSTGYMKVRHLLAWSRSTSFKAETQAAAEMSIRVTGATKAPFCGRFFAVALEIVDMPKVRRGTNAVPRHDD